MDEKLNEKIGFNIGAIIGLILLVTGLFFFSPILTGNATGSNFNTLNILGILLTFAGLIVVYLSLKDMKKTKHNKIKIVKRKIRKKK